MCKKLLFVLYEIFYIVLLHMQEADDIPIRHEDGKEENEVDDHLDAEDLHEIGEFNKAEGEEQHVEWEFVWQNDLIVAMENGHPHDFWIDAE